MSQKIIGIDLGGTLHQVSVLLTQEGEILYSLRPIFWTKGSHIVDDMIESIQHRLLAWIVSTDFRGIGMYRWCG